MEEPADTASSTGGKGRSSMVMMRRRRSRMRCKTGSIVIRYDPRPTYFSSGYIHVSPSQFTPTPRPGSRQKAIVTFPRSHPTRGHRLCYCRTSQTFRMVGVSGSMRNKQSNDSGRKSINLRLLSTKSTGR